MTLTGPWTSRFDHSPPYRISLLMYEQHTVWETVHNEPQRARASMPEGIHLPEGRPRPPGIGTTVKIITTRTMHVHQHVVCLCNGKPPCSSD